MGERAPQFIQNLAIRDYCFKNRYNFILSSVEYAMEGSSLILDEIIKKIQSIDGIAFYILFQLPENEAKRKYIYTKIIENKKSLHFILENLKLDSLNDISKIENIWLIKQTLPKTLNFNEKDFKKFKNTEIVHHYGYYIGNYPSLSKSKILKLTHILNSV